ncbi:MAG: RDD family protein [Pyrinomonadaceae bacterium]
MAATAPELVKPRTTEAERIEDFSPEDLKAPFVLRCAAFCVDYMVVVAIPIIWLIASRLFGDHGASSIGGFVWFIGFLLLAINFVLFPLLRGQTIGKAITGLTIVNLDGSYVRLSGVLRRNVLGYLLTAATLGLGFALGALNSSGRALHDLVGGTVVVRGRRTQI